MGKYKLPMLTIGLPVHNGEDHILDSLECLSRQTYSNFQVIIFENKSTDGTLKIIQQYCEKDNRFSVIPSTSFLPALDNFLRAFNYISKNNGFFSLRSHDDYSSDNYMNALCNALIKHPNMGIAVSDVQFITNNKNVGEFPIQTAILNEDNWKTFNRSFNKIQFPASWIYGVYNSKYAHKIFNTFEYYPNAWAGDRLVILCYLPYYTTVGWWRVSDCDLREDSDR